jgi:hypothetical protein
VGADDHVLVGQVGAGDDRDDIGAARERLRVGGVAAERGVEAGRDRLELVDQELAGGRGAGRAVVATGRVVAGEPGHVDLGAAGEEGGEDEAEERGATHGRDPTLSGEGPARLPRGVAAVR